MSNRKTAGSILVLALLLACPQLGCSGAGAKGEADPADETAAQPASDGGEATAGDGEAPQGDAKEPDNKGTGKGKGKGKGEDDGKEEKKEEAVPVEVAELTRGEIESVLRFSSNLEAEERIKVVSEAKRMITEEGRYFHPCFGRSSVWECASYVAFTHRPTSAVPRTPAPQASEHEGVWIQGMIEQQHAADGAPRRR